MKTIIKFILVLMCVVIFAAPPAISSATNYTFSFFNYPGATATRPNGINSSGKIVGDYDNWSHGFTYEAGVAAPLNVFGSSWSFAYGINTKGYITGVYRGTDGFNYSYLYDDGSVTSFGISGKNTHAGGINDFDQIVGHINDGTTGFFYDSKTKIFEFFVYPGDTIQTNPSGINNNGLISGLYLDNTGWHGFFKKGNDFTSVDHPGALNTYIIGLNNNGEMVGSYDTVLNGERYGFIYKNGIFTPFKIPGYTSINARGITDDGRIVGRAKDANGNWHGFLATPVNITPIVTFLLGD